MIKEFISLFSKNRNKEVSTPDESSEQEREKDIVSIKEKDFKDMVTPIKLENSQDLFLFKCSECGGTHFRHTGYMNTMLPFVTADGQKNVTRDAEAVHTCVKCRKSYIFYHKQMYDVSGLIDLKAWEKCEKEMSKATGPGGEC